jgi:hypothetical protein
MGKRTAVVFSEGKITLFLSYPPQPAGINIGAGHILQGYTGELH